MKPALRPVLLQAEPENRKLRVEMEMRMVGQGTSLGVMVYVSKLRKLGTILRAEAFSPKTLGLLVLRRTTM